LSLTLKSIFYSLVCLFFSHSLLYAQNYGAKFEVNSEIGCDQFTVVATDLSGAEDKIAVNYDWGDGSPLDTAVAHTYDQPGIYTIIQTVANADPRQDTVVVEVIDHYPPEFLLLNCKGMSASVIVRDTLYEAYEIQWGDGNSDIVLANALNSHAYNAFNNFDVTVKGLINGSQSATDSSNFNCSSNTKRLNMIVDMAAAAITQIQVVDTDVGNGKLSIDYALAPDNNYLIEIREQNQASFIIIDTINQITNPTNYILENLNTRDNYYCISITSFDPCDGQTLQSNIGCSVHLQTNALSQQNELLWQTSSTDFLNYVIYKDGVQLANVNSQNNQQFFDNQVACGVMYNYQVRMRENNGLLSISDTSTVTAISTDVPDPVVNITATVEGQNILVSWEEPVNFLAVGYIISKSTNGGPFEVLDTLDQTSFIDADLFTQSKSYTYKIVYYDGCGNLSSESVLARQILLVEEYEQSLSWSEYEGWENGVRAYLLEKYDENGQLIETQNLGQSTSYIEDQQNNPYQYILYKIIAMPNDASLEAAESNILEVIYPSKVVFPNAFSPNGDGINDIFTFKSRYITSTTMKIYNRWGELVFQTSDADQGWDGTVNGKAAPLGTYIHYTQLTDDMGITFIKSGEIVLIR
jgi:gliding motility-associated-like protein